MTELVTIVTGGSRGIGAATALRLGAEGHAVVIGYRSDAAAAAAVAARIRAAGGTCVPVRADTVDEDQVARLFDAAAALGPLTGLVNNAGITGPLGPLIDRTPAELRRVVDVNIMGYLLCAQAAARAMSRGLGGAGGAIVNLSSGAATLGSPGEYVHYAATKAATDALTLGLSKELGPEGIRVNGVAPGTTYTDMHATAGDAGRADRIGLTTPLGRSAQPEEVAAAVVWLLGPEASYVSGTTIRVAGGR